MPEYNYDYKLRPHIYAYILCERHVIWDRHVFIFISFVTSVILS